MNRDLQSLQKRAVHREGRRRLRFVLAAASIGACAAAMLAVLVFYGTPYNPVWWAVMAAILLSSAIMGAMCAPIVEWVIAGYLVEPE